MEEYIHFFQAEKRSIAERLAKYFEYSGLDTKIHFDEDKDVYILSVPAQREKDAKKHYQAFYFVERDRIEKGDTESEALEYDDANTSSNISDLLEEKASLTDFDGSDIVTSSSLGEADFEGAKDEIASSTPTSDDDTATIRNAVMADDTAPIEDDPAAHSDDKPDMKSETNSLEPGSPTIKSLLSGSGSYVMKSEKYKDYTGTQYIFLFLGIAGIIFVILNITEVLTLLNGLFPNLIMAALFIYFIYVAISTGKKAKQLKLEIDEETQLTDKINKWLHDNVTEKFLTSITNSDISEELDYIKKTETIRDMMINEFGEQLNKDFVERLIEEYYNENFDTAEVYTESDIEVDTIKDIGNDIMFDSDDE